ncbi:hypothetical protein ACQ4M3_20530 [Leptolyngbya sp. AN03gr2]|uniref:hypothetical protein n=1 Tax=unclassified Leptolyngbya TaxID=2650499 RepID=UPI003D31F3F5
MKKTKTWITAGAAAVAIGVWTPSAIAQTRPGTPPFVSEQTGQAGAIVATPQETQQQRQNFVQENLNQGRGIVQQVTDFFQNMPQMLKNTIGSFQAPDLGQLTQLLLGGSSTQTPGGQVAERIENQTPGKGSYSIRNDQSNEGFRTTGLTTMQTATLSREAQNRASQVMQATEQATNSNKNLGQESQNLDVSQQILQNISRQMSLTGEVTQTLANEAQQGRVDRAVGNVLAAQTAEEAQVSNIADRRETSGAANSAVRQAGGVTLFGGGTLGKPDN